MNSRNAPQLLALKKSKADLASLLQQAGGVFLMFVIMLVLTGGSPPVWAVPATFLFASGYVFWAEAKIKHRSDWRRSSSAVTGKQKVPIHFLQNTDILAWNQWREEAQANSINLRRTNLRRAILYEADLSEANLFRANLSEANLSGANLRRAILSGANLRRAILFQADLSEANLLRANLSEANLIRVNLSGADLSGANLRVADLREADLREADLSGADLSGANLREADLSGAIFKGTIVDSAIFSGNFGLTDMDKDKLQARGAVFQESPGDTANSLVRK